MKREARSSENWSQTRLLIQPIHSERAGLGCGDLTIYLTTYGTDECGQLRTVTDKGPGNEQMRMSLNAWAATADQLVGP